MTEYKMVAVMMPDRFNEKVKELTDAGFRPFEKPFIRPAFKVEDTYRIQHHGALICQAFVKEENEQQS